MIQVKAGKRADAIRGEKLFNVQHVAQDSQQPFPVHKREQPARAIGRFLAHIDVTWSRGNILQEPLDPFAKVRQIHDHFGLERLHGKERSQPHHGSHL